MLIKHTVLKMIHFQINLTYSDVKINLKKNIKVSGKFDVVGCSHQWWHIFILGAMIYWQQSGNQLLTEYRSFTDSCHRFIPRNFSEISSSSVNSNYSNSPAM